MPPNDKPLKDPRFPDWHQRNAPEPVVPKPVKPDK